MNEPEMNNPTDENKPNMIRKKSSFIRDSSFRLFHIIKKPSDDSDDDNLRSNNNIDQFHENSNHTALRKSVRIADGNGLKEVLFLHETSCESSSSIEVKTSPSPRQSTNELSQSIICPNTTSTTFLGINKKEELTDCFKTDIVDETIMRNKSLVRTSKVERSSKKQVFNNIHPELQASFHRRRKRFLVACGTVVIALSVIITIIIYVVIMTVKYITQMNRSAFYRYPRI